MLQGDQNRRLHWSYQGGNGERFWAEGAYYLEFALLDVLPFWHAIRANGLLDFNNFNVSDPFRSEWALEPLRWMADIATPDGMTVPLDDGNKRPIHDANLLRWSPAYGDADVGDSYTFINEVLGGPSSPDSRDPSTLLNEIAIPRRPAEYMAVPPFSLPTPYGEGPASAIAAGEQQLVIRRIDGEGQTHYVLLNGERGDAITRGEGHEQPDNMQLLYYVGETSVLMDSGYDSAPPFGNSTWNHYYDHNLVNFFDGKYEFYSGGELRGNPPAGGLLAPRIELGTRKVSDHDPAEELWLKIDGQVTVLHAYQFLDELVGREDEFWAQYWRDVLFIGGDDPYLVDLNRLHTWVPSRDGSDFRNRPKFRLNYYSDSPDLSAPSTWEADGDPFIKWSDVSGSGRHLYAHPLLIEFPLKSENINTVRDSVQEGSKKLVKRLDLYDAYDRVPFNKVSYATILQFRATDPPYRPQMIAEYEPPGTNRVRGWQGWVWQQSGEVYDVFIASIKEDQGLGDFAFNLREADPSFPDFALKLPSNESYGFARVVQQGGTWTIAGDYRVGLEVAPLMAEIDGPHAVASGQSATWTATAYGGSGPYAYRWLAGPDPDNLQDTGDTEAEHTHSATADFYLQVEVTSGSETASSPVRRVYVGRPAPPSDLQLLNEGADGEHPLLAWAPSPTPGVSYRLTRCEGSTPGCNEVTTTQQTSAIDEEVTIQSGCQANTGYYVTAIGALGESDATEEVGTCGTPPSTSAGAVASALEAASGVALEAVPDDYALEAAYPNPFNPQATIRFALPEAAEVHLVVYDVVGREVARLAEGPMGAGHHRAVFDGSRLASGLYLYRLTAQGERGAFSKTGRMTLVK